MSKFLYIRLITILNPIETTEIVPKYIGSFLVCEPNAIENKIIVKFLYPNGVKQKVWNPHYRDTNDIEKSMPDQHWNWIPNMMWAERSQ